MTCDVLEVRGGEDDTGHYCPKISVAQCFGCSLHLCEEHGAKCEVCGDIFCSSCLYYHVLEHTKPRQIERLDRLRKHA